MAGRAARKIYGTRRWAWTRRAVLRAAGYRCAGCGRGAREVDHILAVARGGAAFELSNLQPLCRRCHHAKTRADLGVQSTPWQRLVKELACGPGIGSLKKSLREASNASSTLQYQKPKGIGRDGCCFRKS